MIHSPLSRISMEQNLINNYIPNWKRFIEKYNPEKEFMETFLDQLSDIDDTEDQITVAKRINVELWILLLHDREINSNLFSSILESMSEKIIQVTH